MRPRPIAEYVQLLRFIEGAVDAHGNETESWEPAGPPAGETTIPATDLLADDASDYPVWGFDPGGSTEPAIDGRGAVITQPTLYMPPDVVFGPRDRVIVRGRTFEMDGETREWRRAVGPVGNVASLRRVDG